MDVFTSEIAPKKLADLARAALEVVVEFGRLLLDHFTDVRRQAVGRQLQPRFGFGAVAFDGGTGAARDLQHRHVFAQRMDEQHFDAAVARMQHRVLEQAATEAAGAGLRQHRNAELRHRRAARDRRDPGMRQVRHRDQLEPAVEDAEHFVLFEVQHVDVLRHLGVGRRVAEAKIAIAHIQCHQVGRDALAVPRAKRADRHPRPTERRAPRRVRWRQGSERRRWLFALRGVDWNAHG